MIITADSLLPRPKLDCDGGYDVGVKGPSVVVGKHGIGKYIKSAWNWEILDKVSMELDKNIKVYHTFCGTTAQQHKYKYLLIQNKK